MRLCFKAGERIEAGDMVGIDADGCVRPFHPATATEVAWPGANLLDDTDPSLSPEVREKLKRLNRGRAFTLPDGNVLLPAPVPFAYETAVDGQSVRLEAPTLDGLLALMVSQDAGTGAVRVDVTSRADAADGPHVVGGM